MKLCECGCGNPAPIAKRTRKECNHIKGQPIRFINGHRPRTQATMEKSHAWKGGIIKNNRGRYLIYLPKHQKANVTGYVPRYYLIVEKVIGKPLPKNAVIHHVDENQANDINSNLVACENDGYHRLLHQRKRAYSICGNVNWRKCSICKQYDDPENLYIRTYKPRGGCIYHKKCKSMKQKKEYLTRKQSGAVNL